MKKSVWPSVKSLPQNILFILLLCLLADWCLVKPTHADVFSGRMVPNTTKAIVEAEAEFNGQPRITDVAAASTTDTEGIHGKQWMVKKAPLDYAQSMTDCPPSDSTPPTPPINLRIGAIRAGYGFLASHVTPSLANRIPDQAATEDEKFSFVFAANTFNDAHGGSSLTYKATFSPSGSHPSWLTFTPTTRAFSGTPTNDDVGPIIVHVIASDGTAHVPVCDDFVITVRNTNDAPTVATAIPDQTAMEDVAFSFQFAAGTFNDVDVGDTLAYSATLSNGATLPGWLTFTPTTRAFSGTPRSGDVGSITVGVTANDGTASVSDDFILTVKAARSLTITNNYNSLAIDHFIVRLRIASTDANKDKASERLGPDLPLCQQSAGDSVPYGGSITIPKTAIPVAPELDYELFIGFGYWTSCNSGGVGSQKYNNDTLGSACGNCYHYINVKIQGHSSGVWTINIIQDSTTTRPPGSPPDKMTLINEFGTQVKIIWVKTENTTDPVDLNINPD